MNHFTNKAGWNGIRSAPTWLFKAADPPPEDHPFGAYFTTLPRSTPRLAMRLRVPRTKIEYVFEFQDAGDLRPLRGFRGSYVFYSPEDYSVSPERQGYDGPTEER